MPPSSCSSPPRGLSQPSLRGPFRTSRHGAYRFEKGGWIYVHLEGSPEQIGFQHGSLLAARDRRLPAGHQAVPRESTRRDWDFYREASEKMLWPCDRRRVSPGDRRHRGGLAGKGDQGRPLGSGRFECQPGASLLLRSLAGQEGGEDAVDPRPRQLQRLHRHRQLYQGRPDRHGPQRLDQLRRRHALEHRLRHQAAAGLAHDHGRLAGRDRQRRRFRRQLRRHHGHRDDDHPVRGLGPRRRNPNSCAPRRRCNTASRSTTSSGSCSTATTAATPTTG